MKIDVKKLEELGLVEPSKKTGRKRYLFIAACPALILCTVLGLAMAAPDAPDPADIITIEKQREEAAITIRTMSLLNTDDVEFTAEAGPMEQPEEHAEDEPIEEEDIIELLAETIEEETSLVMVKNVETALNVRTGPSTDDKRAGLMYNGCGGTVLERKDGWTKLQSGDLIGWASDEYLAFGEEALALAEEYGNYIAKSEASSLRVRTEPNTDSEILGVLMEDDVLEVTGVVNDEWVEVAYGSKIGYVSSEWVSVEFYIDKGETIEVIREREAAYAAAQAKKQSAANSSADYVSGDDDLTLMAAIIYCEAGNQSYEGMVAVGSVVMNRVNSSAFPNTIEGVLRASGQFSPVGSGKFDKVLKNGGIPETCWQAAADALSGTNNIGGALYFKNPKLAGSHSGQTIGDHVFW